MNGRVIAALLAGALIGGTAVTTSRWEANDEENDAFTKDCNDCGRVVIFGMPVCQCLGAGPTKEAT